MNAWRSFPMKKNHDLKVAISRNKIKIREINKLLVETEQ